VARVGDFIVEGLTRDIVTVLQCMVLDAEVFPYASVQFGLALRDEASRVWVARECAGGCVVGFAAVRRRSGEQHVDGIAVEPNWRRRGVGRALLRAAIDGVLPTILHVSTTNAAAIALYEGEGFAVRRVLVHHYPRGVYPDDGHAYEMVRDP
jgi:ribosomal protein S18 acetylase RimI-like enzyme